MKYPITNEQLEQLKFYERHYILVENKVYMFKSFQYETAEHVNWLGKTITKIYLTDYTVIGRNREMNKLRCFEASPFELVYNISKHRKDWELMKGDLELFGLEIKTIENHEKL